MINCSKFFVLLKQPQSTFNPLSANPTKWSNTLKKLVDFAKKLFECV